MGEEVKMTEYEVPGEGDDAAGGEDRVMEWEMDLPSCEDLMPLTQPLVPPELAVAFSISPERSRTIQDVNRASQTTLSALRNGSSSNDNSNSFKTTVAEAEDLVGSDPKKQKKSDGGGGAMVAEEADSGTEDPSARTVKRPRLVWTPQLHKRFVEVVAHLGIKNAVPKTIMQLMNVEGLTRENVASHLQKYRLYLKRMQGLTTDGGPSSSDHLFSSTPVPPQSFHDGGGSGGGGGSDHVNGASGHTGLPHPVPYGAPPPMMPTPIPAYGYMGMQGYHHHHHHHHSHGHDHYHHGTGGSGVFESNPFMMQQKDWPGNKYGSMASYPAVGGGGGGVNDK
ncbi:PREDICTED: transcription factor LUX-like [Tarenaya hassleriana]|uniref:transcription factor LUX-like n=1 Tax=Tarenaya hassleriana TaxID=28532 RepID=UPI00053C7759|nr:PREDICTED: transcription factor LUX-like [Tarenaya hassleriana]